MNIRLRLAGRPPQSEWSCHEETQWTPRRPTAKPAPPAPPPFLPVLWGDHSTLQHWNILLARVTDAHLKRGEWAE